MVAVVVREHQVGDGSGLDPDAEQTVEHVATRVEEYRRPARSHHHGRSVAPWSIGRLSDPSTGSDQKCRQGGAPDLRWLSMAIGHASHLGPGPAPPAPTSRVGDTSGAWCT